MERRRLLRLVGAAGVAGLAGCIGGQRDPANGGPSPTPDGLETSFTTTASRCGTQGNDARVSVDDGTVTVEGTTWGNDGCYAGRLDSVTLEDGTLTVRVTAERRDDVQGCVQCITEIDYRLTVAVPRRPTEVVVVHRGEPVRTVRP